MENEMFFCFVFVCLLPDHDQNGCLLPDHDQNGQHKANTKAEHRCPGKEPDRCFVEEQEERFREQVDELAEDSDQRERSSDLVWADQLRQGRPGEDSKEI